MYPRAEPAQRRRAQRSADWQTPAASNLLRRRLQLAEPGAQAACDPARRTGARARPALRQQLGFRREPERARRSGDAPVVQRAHGIQQRACLGGAARLAAQFTQQAHSAPAGSNRSGRLARAHCSWSSALRELGEGQDARRVPQRAARRRAVRRTQAARTAAWRCALGTISVAPAFEAVGNWGRKSLAVQ